MTRTARRIVVPGVLAGLLAGIAAPVAAGTGPVVPPVTAGPAHPTALSNPTHVTPATASDNPARSVPLAAGGDVADARLAHGRPVIRAVPAQASSSVWCNAITAVLCGAIGIGSVAAGAAAAALGDTIIKPMVDGLVDGLVTLLETGLTWWMSMPTVSVTGSGVFGLGLQALMLGVGMLIATVLLLLQTIRTMIARRGAPLLEALEGLVKLAFMAAAGVALVNALALASDGLTAEIQRVAFTNDSGLTDRLTRVLILHPEQGLMLTLLLTLVGFVVGLAQLVVFFIRQAALPIQALLIPVAAAGQVGGGSSRQWLARLWAGILALIFYKPAAMLVLAVGFAETGEGATVIDVVRGLMTLVLSILALPVLLRMFTPILEGLVGRGGSLLSAAYTGLWAYSALRGRGSSPTGGSYSPVRHEQAMRQTGPAAGRPDPWQPPPSPASPAAASGPPAVRTGTAAGGARTPARTAAGTAATAGTAAAVTPVAVAVAAAEAAHRAARRAAEAMTETPAREATDDTLCVNLRPRRPA